ncbi:MAG: MotA/TolQ/ExbB proton channel family protein [Taibaiella sp.]|nr:MotA/TolQ/ExbB proton channel family protein [Taibaiella sp.]
MQLLSAILLQLDTVAQATDLVEETSAEKLSLIYLLKEGGILMIPLLLCSVLMVYVFLERLFVIRKAADIDPTFMARIREHVTDGNLTGAKNLAKNTQGPMARIIDKGLSRIGKPIEHIERSMENTGKLQVYNLEKNLSILSTIAGIAPMFGFLGTIAGMIILFFNIQHQGFSIENIAGGIYTKMVTSAVGLIIGLLSYVAYNYLNAQINKAVNKMEAASVEFLDILHEPTK